MKLQRSLPVYAGLCAWALIACCLTSCTSPDPQKKTEITPAQLTAFEQLAATDLLMHSYGRSSDRKSVFRVQGMAAKLAQAAGTQPIGCVLVFGNGFANAYPAPGRMIMLTDNLYLIAKNDDELAALIGHQIGHILSGHPMAKLKTLTMENGMTGTNAIASSDPADMKLPVNDPMKALADKVIELKYNPLEEQEAEQTRIKITTAAGYRSDVMPDLLISLQRASDAVKRAPEYFVIHPPRL